MTTIEITETAAREAFRVHVVDKAQRARHRHGPDFDPPSVRAMLADSEVVRYATTLSFDAAPLQAHEFAFARAIGFHASDGFDLHVHPAFETRPETWAMLVGYHLPVINYGPLADDETCALYAATLLDMDGAAFDERLVQLADSIGLAVRQATNVP